MRGNRWGMERVEDAEGGDGCGLCEEESFVRPIIKVGRKA